MLDVVAYLSRRGSSQTERHGATFTKRERNSLSTLSPSVFLSLSLVNTPRPRSVHNRFMSRYGLEQAEDKETNNGNTLLPVKNESASLRRPRRFTSILLRRSIIPQRSITDSLSLTR